MEMMLNSQKPEVVEKYLDLYPIDGVTTNPQMIGEEKGKKYFEILKSLRSVIGGRKLFTQVVSNVYEEMLEEAELIRKIGGANTYVKVPANANGVKVIKTLTERGYDTLGTVVFTSTQGIMALKAGAKYVAPFFGPMLDVGIDADTVVSEMAQYIKKSGCQGKIMAAACRDAEQAGRAIAAGVDCLTFSPKDLDAAMTNETSDIILNMFIENWEAGQGKGVKIIDFK
ncbi:MAG TPA: transaldolase family protein [Syntrophomonas sp.]|nr:transaldolase family protein [Syntrophomonas sp.]